MSLLDLLRDTEEFGPRLKELEKLETEIQAAVALVDLDIAFSPILLNTGDTTQEAVEIYKGEDGRYVCRNPFKILSEVETKKARARFLVQRAKEMEPVMDRLFKAFEGGES